jgi:hypothetical protein
MSLFDRARLIFLYRDGRDVIDSLVAMSGPGGLLAGWRGVAVETREQRLALIREESLNWVARMTATELAFEQRPPQLRWRLRYEDLVAEPEARLREVCAFLGLEFEPGMLEYHRRENPALYADHPRLAEPPVRDARSWRKEMRDGDVELFEAIAGELLTELGYERAHPSPGRSARAAAERAAYTARLGVWRTALPLVRKSPAWRLRQVYIRRG